MSKAKSADAHAPARGRREPERIDGADARADRSEAPLDGTAGELSRQPSGLEGLEAPGQARGERRRMRAAGAVSGAAWMALARQLDELDAVEEHVDDADRNGRP